MNAGFPLVRRWLALKALADNFHDVRHHAVALPALVSEWLPDVECTVVLALFSFYAFRRIYGRGINSPCSSRRRFYATGVYRPSG